MRSDTRITVVGCWAHTGDTIADYVRVLPNQIVEVESLIRMLHDVADQIRELDDAGRLGS